MSPKIIFGTFLTVKNQQEPSKGLKTIAWFCLCWPTAAIIWLPSGSAWANSSPVTAPMQAKTKCKFFETEPYYIYILHLIFAQGHCIVDEHSMTPPLLILHCSLALLWWNIQRQRWLGSNRSRTLPKRWQRGRPPHLLPHHLVLSSERPHPIGGLSKPQKWWEFVPENSQCCWSGLFNNKEQGGQLAKALTDLLLFLLGIKSNDQTTAGPSG